ncbi:pentatricopeptide repeat-containing protein At2g35030, mitochondrial-like [Selaginella moellendorffii]|uniref:pentatricopeptide repeat-containing protein At2g35030, mitochondrial-like n=1 Tax=Selaginella moellendorffii TaxID=88036 RepID=UPI000D1C7108|nr:pentatricopeptide repeat-containing protein At2g35030, mitochondrial-like [Selaginella moellendorffii]|eukprot:XP_024526815.1 pentatricopeptide repeat-containing protein At2g35030, mitochondrial-like [Selaginella moellendorffii]
MTAVSASCRESLARLLRQCSSLVEGRALHARIAAAGFADRDVLLSNMLVRMYGNCGSVGDACRVFDAIEPKNRFSWNMILAAYAENGHIDAARAAFVAMPARDLVAWTVLIAGFAKSGEMEAAIATFLRTPQWDSPCWNVLIAAFAQTGQCAQAKHVFDFMPEPDSISWNTLMQAFAQHHSVCDAKEIFDRMPARQLSSWNCLLTASAQAGDLQWIDDVFDRIPLHDVISWTAFLGAYAESHKLDSAQEIFDRMPERNAISWNAMIAVNAKAGRIHDSWSMLRRMPQHSVNPWNAILQHCPSIDRARELFQSMRHRNLLSWNTALGVFAEQIATMGELFDRMPARSIVSFNAAIKAHTDRGDVHGAMAVLDSIPGDGGSGGDLISWTMIVAAHARRYGGAADAIYLFDRLPHRDLYCWNALLVALAENVLSGDHLIHAKRLFDRMPAHDSCASNAMIQVLAAEHRIDGAKTVFDRIPRPDLQLLPGTSMISLLGRSGGSSLSQALAIFHSLAQRDQASWNAIVEACARFGEPTIATAAIDRMPQRDEIAWVVIITELARHEGGSIDRSKALFDSIGEPTTPIWNAIIAAHCHCKLYRGAIQCFREMDLSGVESDEVTFLAVLDACLGAPALTEGRIIHASLVDRFHSRHYSEIITNTLINFYGKSGCLREAMEIFHGSKLGGISSSSWNVMIGAYAHNGLSDRASELVELMALDGSLPDASTLTSLLTACAHAGKLRYARDYFVTLKGDFFVEPDRDHFGCVVDLLGRSGRLQEALELVESMPFEPDAVALTSLLSSCRNLHSSDEELAIGGRVLGKLAEVSSRSAVFVMASSMQRHAQA